MARKSLPTVVGNIPNDLRIWIDRVREILDSNGNDRLVSVSELTSGSVKIPGSSSSSDITGGSGSSNNFQTPPAPTNVVTSGAMDNIIVTWDMPNYTGHAYVEIWSAVDDVIGHAVKVGMVPGAIFVHNLGQAATRYYWVRFVNQDFETGDFNATAGTEGKTGTNPNYVLGLIANATDLNPVQVKANAFQVVDPNATQGTISPFTVITATTTINGVTVNPGVYMNALYVMDGSITNAKIGNAAIDDAKIANLSADKVTFGRMSGDRISVKSLNADRINVTQLSGIAADLGTVTAGLFKTSNVTSGWRTEIDSAGSFPFWYGTGNKIASNAKFYMDVNGNITIQGGNFTIKDTSGNVVMSSGGAVWDYVTGTNKPANNATVGADSSNLAIGTSVNLIKNADFYNASLSGWLQTDIYLVTGISFGVDLASDWTPSGGHAAWVWQNNNLNPTGYIDIGTENIPVKANQRYEFQCKTGAHRCNVQVFVYWFNASGAILGYSNLISNNAELYGGTSLNNYKLCGDFCVSPTNTTYAKLIVRKNSTLAGNTDSLAFFTQAYFGEALPNQTEFSKWVAGGSAGAFTNLQQINSSNASTYIANAAIGSAQIGSIALVGTSNFSVNSLVNGTGTIQDNRGVRIYSNGVRRVMLGDLSVPNGQ